MVVAELTVATVFGTQVTGRYLFQGVRASIHKIYIPFTTINCHIQLIIPIWTVRRKLIHNEADKEHTTLLTDPFGKGFMNSNLKFCGFF